MREEARLRTRRERRAAESSDERETRLAKRRVADRARYAANSDRRTELGMLQIQTGEQSVAESVVL